MWVYSGHMGQGVHCQIVKLRFGKETRVGNIVDDVYANFVFSVKAEDRCFDAQENIYSFPNRD